MHNSLYLLFALILCLTSGRFSNAATFFVNATTGSNANAGTSAGAAFQTISHAITQAANGDVINVAAGTYAEAVTVSKSLTINGANAGVPGSGSRGSESIITGSTTRDGFIISATDVRIDGFSVQDGGGNNYGGVGFVLTGGISNVTIINNIITNNVIGLTTVYNTTQTNVSIQDNLFDSNNRPGPASGFGIYLQSLNTTGFSVRKNVFRGQTNPVFLTEGLGGTHTGLAFSENNIEATNSAAGSKVYLTGVSNGVVTQNTFSALGGTRSLRLDAPNAGVNVSNNFISFNATQSGVVISNTGGGSATNSGVIINNNSFTGGSGFAINNETTTLVDGQCNWFGTASGINAFVNGPVTYTPFLTSGTDTAPVTVGFQPVANNCSCPPPTVTLVFNNSATVMGMGIPTITVPPGAGQSFQVFGGTSFEYKIILAQVNGYEIRGVDKNTSGLFPINLLGLFSLTVTDSNGCSRTVQGILANP